MEMYPISHITTLNKEDNINGGDDSLFKRYKPIIVYIKKHKKFRRRAA